MGQELGSLIVAVNVVGSLFYGSLLGCFVLALGFRRVGGTAIFVGMLAGEAAVFSAFFHRISWLWYNVMGCGWWWLPPWPLRTFRRAKLPRRRKRDRPGGPATARQSLELDLYTGNNPVNMSDESEGT